MGPVRYARNGDVHLAYTTVGEGPDDIVWIPGWFSDFENGWDIPGFGSFLEELSELGRLIVFDKRGTGQSDRIHEHPYPSLEERVDDVLAVMDAVGSGRAALVGASEGGSQALLTAARHPDRVSAVVAIDAWARLVADGDDQVGVTPEQLVAFITRAVELWGTGRGVGVLVPSRKDDPLFVERWASFERRAASPSAIDAYGRLLGDLDIRDTLGDVSVPTLVIHATGDRMVPVAQGRYLAEQVPDAHLVEVASSDHLPFISDPEVVLEAVQRHLIGHVRPPTTALRQFAALLLTDIVASTDHAAAIGDRHWRSLLDAYEELAATVVADRGGRLVKSTGDGTLATFADPHAAVLAARQLHGEVAVLGIQLRTGLHCGQVELRAEDVGGIAVHIAARVAGLAAPGATLVSSTVRDVLLGSPVAFTASGTHELRGVPGTWDLFELETA